MGSVTAIGQFGPDQFAVLSTNLVVVDAKWLRDSTGSSYIIDPNTGRPYIVPREYDPAVTAAYFTNKLNQVIADDSGVSSVVATIYPELMAAFVQGSWGDIQRPLSDKTDVVPAFIAAASFNLGVAAAAGGVSASEAIFFGGAYNVLKNGTWNLVTNPLGFGNNPDNPDHIRDGADQFGRGSFGIHDAENTTTPDGMKTTTVMDVNGDGRTDVILTTTKAADNSYVEDAKYLASNGSTREETVTGVNAAGTKATTTVDINGDGRWETEIIALANGSIQQNTAINDDGTSTKTVFDTGAEPWSSETSAFDAYQRLQSQRVVFDAGGQQVKQYDPDNSHPYNELDVSSDSTGKVTAAQLVLDQNIIAAGGAIGQIFGSAIGNALAPNDPFARILTSTVAGLIGQKLLLSFTASLTLDASRFVLGDFASVSGLDVAHAGIGAISSFLTAELGHELHLEGLSGQLFNGIVGGVTGSVLNQVVDKIATGVSFDAAIGAIQWGTAVTQAGYNVSSILGSYLGHELVPAQTHEGAVGGQLLGAVGSAIGIGLALGNALGTVLNFIAPGIGSLIGTIVGTLIGDAFGSHPHPAAVDLIDQAGYFYSYGHSQLSASDGGDYRIPDQMKDPTLAIINAYLGAVKGAALDHSKQAIIGYTTAPDFRYLSGTPGHPERTFTDVNDAVHAVALDVLQNLEVIGGDLLMKRAHHVFINTPHPNRNRGSKARRPVRASGWRRARGMTASFACSPKRFA
jgi:hypothetical protein